MINETNNTNKKEEKKMAKSIELKKADEEFEFAKSEHSEAVEALDSARKKLNAEIDERIEMAKKTLSQGPTVLDLISEREALLGLAGDISEVWV